MTLYDLKALYEAAVNWNDRINSRGYVDNELEQAIKTTKEILTQHSIIPSDDD